MNRLALLFSVLFALNAIAKINNDFLYLNLDYISVFSEENELEKLLFVKVENSSSTYLDISTIEVIELEKEVELGFDTTNYLPENFNALKGKHDLDWSSIEVIELEEEVEINFDTKAYLPTNFNPYAGMQKDVVEACLN